MFDTKLAKFIVEPTRGNYTGVLNEIIGDNSQQNSVKYKNQLEVEYKKYASLFSDKSEQNFKWGFGCGVVGQGVGELYQHGTSIINNLTLFGKNLGAGGLMTGLVCTTGGLLYQALEEDTHHVEYRIYLGLKHLLNAAYEREVKLNSTLIPDRQIGPLLRTRTQ